MKMMKLACAGLYWAGCYFRRLPVPIPKWRHINFSSNQANFSNITYRGDTRYLLNEMLKKWQNVIVNHEPFDNRIKQARQLIRPDILVVFQCLSSGVHCIFFFKKQCMEVNVGQPNLSLLFLWKISKKTKAQSKLTETWWITNIS